MNKIAVVYWSGTGNTAAMALAVKDGVQAAGGETVMMAAAEFDPSMVETFDGIAFGCPSMGAEELEEEEFQPMFSACEERLKDKKIALFGSYGWGDGEWMRSWEDICTGDGATLVCDSVICNGLPDESATAACRLLGTALAR